MSDEKGNNHIDIRQIFLGLQKEMITKLTTGRENILHPPTKGEISELNWIEWFMKYLPKRYQIDKAFIIDSNGMISDQIDLVIYDRQYSPFLFNQKGAIYIPAESVYAVFEIKQSLNRKNIKYAGLKVASVRTLYRTSAPIPHAGGEYEPRKPISILAGILAMESEWNPPFSTPFKEALISCNKFEQLDLGCALRHGSFEAIYQNGSIEIKTSNNDDALIFFFLTLLSRLQQVGTVPAIDISEYAKHLRRN